MVSGGRNAVTSTSIPTRSRTACWYSARLSRWNGRQPGFGLSAAAASIFVSSESTNDLMTAGSGRFAFGGGIMPARSLRIIFSATSGCCSTFAVSKPASVSPPALPRSLWHVAQYWAINWFCDSGDIAVEAAGPSFVEGPASAPFGGAAGDCARPPSAACSAASSPWCKSSVASRLAMRPAGAPSVAATLGTPGKARRPRISGIFEGGATQPEPGSPTRQPRWGGEGMQRRPNAVGLSPRAASPSAVSRASHRLRRDRCPGKHDGHAVDVAYNEFSNAIRLIRRLHRDDRTATDDFSVVGVDILDPLKQMDAAWVSTVSHEVNGGVVAPHHRVSLVAEIRREPKHITIERGCRLDARNIQDPRALNELCRTGRWQCGHEAAPVVVEVSEPGAPWRSR